MKSYNRLLAAVAGIPSLRPLVPLEKQAIARAPQAAGSQHSIWRHRACSILPSFRVSFGADPRNRRRARCSRYSLGADLGLFCLAEQYSNKRMLKFLFFYGCAQLLKPGFCTINHDRRRIFDKISECRFVNPGVGMLWVSRTFTGSRRR